MNPLNQSTNVVSFQQNLPNKQTTTIETLEKKIEILNKKNLEQSKQLEKIQKLLELILKENEKLCGRLNDLQNAFESRFPGNQSRLIPLPGDMPRIPAPGDGRMILKAPFTLVRSEDSDVDLKISILFNKTFQPKQPTFPAPSKEEPVKGTDNHRHTWIVHVNKDRTLTVKNASGTDQKIHLIWWEANRNNSPKPFTFTDSTCVKKEEIGIFIQEVLTKRGISEEEQAAFIKYWESSLKNQITDPYLQVRLVEEKEQSDFLPIMNVDSKEMNFKLARHYFRFTPVKENNQGLSKINYLEKITEQQLGSNAVIDLGGEIVNNDGTAAPESNETAFNIAFINNHIRA